MYYVTLSYTHMLTNIGLQDPPSHMKCTEKWGSSWLGKPLPCCSMPSTWANQAGYSPAVTWSHLGRYLCFIEITCRVPVRSFRSNSDFSHWDIGTSGQAESWVHPVPSMDLHYGLTHQFFNRLHLPAPSMWLLGTGWGKELYSPHLEQQLTGRQEP